MRVFIDILRDSDNSGVSGEAEVSVYQEDRVSISVKNPDREIVLSKEELEQALNAFSR